MADKHGMMNGLDGCGGAGGGGCGSRGPDAPSTRVLRDDEVREQDRFLPTANISRIMKKSLPPNAKIAKDAKDTTQECVSEFISFITMEASEKCQQEKRKTINGDDILWAMSSLGFDKYVGPLKTYLQKYRESVKADTPGKGKKDALEGISAPPPPAIGMSHGWDQTAQLWDVPDASGTMKGAVGAPPEPPLKNEH